MPRHHFGSRRLRREIQREANDPPPQVSHLHVTLSSATSILSTRDARPLGNELAQLRARLLQMIIANESARRATKTLS
ncbi:MAG: hypothetical protein WD851_05630 [Pirellulales bacterium]